MSEPDSWNHDERNEWREVIFASDCDDEGNCPVCDIDYAECSCPGPSQEEDFVYEVIDRVLMARRRKPGE